MKLNKILISSLILIPFILCTIVFIWYITNLKEDTRKIEGYIQQIYSEPNSKILIAKQMINKSVENLTPEEVNKNSIYLVSINSSDLNKMEVGQKVIIWLNSNIQGDSLPPLVTAQKIEIIK
ncbi:DUF3221 domain-containing protein [Bacillus salitolerans]|uniref:DUF3221 domain-containing protein n=1 Tax=Bacillus salitolerans TaxID=1437434 RepID=A0ABW4LQZ5_9BACI